MTRYIKQNHTHDCVPVAIFNALRFYNKTLSIKYLGRIKRLCKTNKYCNGTRFEDAVSTLKRYFSIKIIDPIFDEELVYHLKYNPAIFWSVACNEWGSAHVCLMEKYFYSQNKITIINWGERKRKILFEKRNKIEKKENDSIRASCYILINKENQMK